jgi:PKD repeat protein
MNKEDTMKKSILTIVMILFSLSLLYSDRRITRGPNIGEIYYIGAIATGKGIYHSTDFGQSTICMDSTSNLDFSSISADLRPGVLYSCTFSGGLYISYNYGIEGSWIFRTGNVSDRISSGAVEGFLYHGFWRHSEDYGITFINHVYNGYFGSFSAFEIDPEENIGYVLVYENENNTMWLLISYDNFENLEIQNMFSDYIGTNSLTRGYQSGELFMLCNYNNTAKKLFYSDNFGVNWEQKNSFSCPNLPIRGIVGGRQPGEIYMLVEYTQLMHTIQHTYIWHSTDYGETFSVYNTFSYGPEPYFANFIASPTTGQAPLTVQFTDISSGENNQEWYWDFDGDGVIDSNEQHPEYTYQEQGIYRVSLTIFGSGQSETTATQEIIVTDSSGTDNYELEIGNYKLNNYPNPFNPSTTIQFNSEHNQQNEQIELEIYNIKGQRVKQFKIHNSTFNINEVVWDGTDSTNNSVSSGIYFYKLNVKNSPIKKMILLK